jgi:tetratricopeptide (TPR) repeat protein
MQNQLLTFGAVFMAGTVGNALLSGTALPLVLATGTGTTGISTADLECFWARAAQQLRSRDAVQQCAGLAKAISMAIAKTMACLSRENFFQAEREALQRLASRAVVDWVALIKAADNLQEIGSEPQEASLAPLLGGESTDFGQIKALTPKHWHQILDVWLEKEPQWIGDVSVINEIAEVLCAEFPKTFREVLREDFAAARHASETMMLQFWEDVRGMLQVQHDHLLVRLSQQKEVNYPQIEQAYGAVWARLDGLVAGNTQVFQDLANRVQTLSIQQKTAKAGMSTSSTGTRDLETPLAEGEGQVQVQASPKAKEEAGSTESALKEFMALVDEHPLLVGLAAGLEEGDRGFNGVTNQEPSFYLFELVELHRRDPVASMNGLIAVSFGQLEERLQRLLCNVSVYRSPFNTMAAAVMLKETALNWQDVAAQQFIEQDLQQLVKKSLLQATEMPDRPYQVLPLIAHALQRQVNDWSWAHERAIFFYRATAKAGCLQSEAEAQAYLETFHHHCELQQFSLANGTLMLCHNFLAAWGRHPLLVELYERLLQGWQPTHGQEYSEFSAALGNLGAAYAALGQYPKAISLYEQALVLQCEIGDRNGEANSLMGLANVCSVFNQLSRAVTLYEQSIVIRRELGNIPEERMRQCEGEAHAWFRLGKILPKVDRADDALAAYRNARQLYSELGLRTNVIACSQAMRQLSSLPELLHRHLVLPLGRIFQRYGHLKDA